MSRGVSYSEIRPVNGHEAFEFEIESARSSFSVQISREALEDFIENQGLIAPTTTSELEHYMMTYQPEFVQIALEKFRQTEKVLITSEDVND